MLPIFFLFNVLVYIVYIKENATKKAKEDAILTFFKAKLANSDLDKCEKTLVARSRTVCFRLHQLWSKCKSNLNLFKGDHASWLQL